MSKIISSLLAASALVAGTAQATTVRLNGSETNLQQIANNLTVGGVSSTDVINDQYSPDQVWQISSLYGFGTSMIALELAGFAGSNRLGLYDINNSSNRLQLFSGGDSAGAVSNFWIDGSGHVFRNFVDSGTIFSSNHFGFYLETPNNTWFSQGALNSDGADHMVAYRGEGDLLQTTNGIQYFGPDSFLLGWEDVSSSGWDQDYNDMVVQVRDVKGVPEPATLGLLGLGLAGIGAMGRRRSKTQKQA